MPTSDQTWDLLHQVAEKLQTELEPGHGFGIDDVRFYRLAGYNYETGFGHQHQCVNTSRGVEVDEKIRDLIEALWACGYDTDKCCQGGDVEYGHEGFHIVFTTLEQAYRFMARTLEVVPSDVIWKVGLGPMTEGRGKVEIPADLLPEVTALWAADPEALTAQPMSEQPNANNYP